MNVARTRASPVALGYGRASLWEFAPVGSRRGFTLVELLAAVAGMAVTFGLIIGLARYVRDRSADTLTRSRLTAAGVALDRHVARQGPPDLPAMGLVTPATRRPREATLRRHATAGVLPFATLLNLPPEGLTDAWGSPLAYRGRGHAEIGTAPGDRPFFFSAGPDGLFLTRGDNLYSYELAGGVTVRRGDGR